MIDKSSILQIFGSLMKTPNLLSQTDKYQLTPLDFSTKLDKYIFRAIENLYKRGANRISPIDVENYFETIEVAKLLFSKENGIEYLQDAEYLSDENNFDYYYQRLKKFNLLKSLKESGIDITDFYIENPVDPRAIEINQKFEDLTIKEIIDSIKKKVLKAELEFNQDDATETQTAFEGMQEVIDDAEDGSDIGLPVQGAIFNTIVSGARKGALYIRSAGSGTGKTRQAVGDACYLAFPFRYSHDKGRWVQVGNDQKVLFIATEQNFKEIRKMILSYLTGINESRFRYGNFSSEEELLIRQAMEVLKRYENNFFIVRMANPSIELVKTIVRENCLTKGIEYVFYDYIFIGPSLLNEFKGINLRNDEVLLMFATALKDLAVELDIFVMTSTQLNAKGDSNENIRNESALAGSRSIINKADVGVICARPTKDELEILINDEVIMGCQPNLVTDIYKVRSGAFTQVRIWSYIDLGTLRKDDLFITDARLQPLVDFKVDSHEIIDWDSESYQDAILFMNKLEEMK